MSPPPDPTPRARNPWGWLAGVLILGLLAGGVVAMAMVLWDRIDMQAITRSPVSATGPAPIATPPAPASRPQVAFPAYVFHSEASRGYFPEEDFYEERKSEWRAVAEGMGATVSLVEGVDDLREIEGEGVVVAAAAICLTNGEVEALTRHLLAGGGLIINWAFGARDGDCEWQGWDRLLEVTGAREVRELEERPGLYLTIPDSSPLSQGIEPAARVELRWDAPVALATEGPRVYWSDWAMNPAPAEGTSATDGAAHLREVDGGGRLAWFGFHGVEGRGLPDEDRIETLFRNALGWTAQLPSAEIRAWPHGHGSAVTITQQAGWEFSNVANLAEAVADLDLPATFFVASRMALDYPELGHVLAEAGEVASRSVDDQPVVGLPLDEQRTRLRQSISHIQGWVGEAPLGLRPPEEAYDATILQAWRSEGGQYVVGVGNGRTGSPELHDTEAGPIVVLPRVTKDDYNILVQDRVLGQDAVVREFNQGLTKIQILGGLSILTTHSQLAGQSRHMGAIRRVLEGIRADENAWVATAGEVAEWTLARRSATVAINSWDPDHQLEIQVEAPDDRGLSGAWVEVVLPGDLHEWEAEIDGQRVEFAPTAWGIAVPVGPVPAGQFQTLAVTRVQEPE
jgi:peptidoglycan/xylan/chitin deacetylase (PgdA/CDA1 family)